jgi:S-adenosylmethionine-diacylglycerol 3-amino-3-carboxypropyl transferase
MTAVRYDLVRYANGWEDADVLCAALRPRPGQRLLSIAAAGDMAFALAAEGAEVVAVDLSPAQLALVELKRAAIRRLDHAEVLAFLGVREADDRLATYRLLEPELSDAARGFWRARPRDVARGVIHAGRFERYFALFRRFVLPLVHRRATVRALLAPRSRDERVEFFDRRWDNRRWRLLFRLFFGRFLQGRLGRDPQFLAHVEGSVTDGLLARTRRALTELDPAANPMVAYVLTGGFGARLPRYLEPERFAAVRAGCARITLRRGPVQSAEGAFDGFHLSDVFEYLSPPTSQAVFRALVAKARPGARLAYWNMLVDRRCGAGVAPLDELAGELHARDRGWFYRAFCVDEVQEPQKRRSEEKNPKTAAVALPAPLVEA